MVGSCDFVNTDIHEFNTEGQGLVFQKRGGLSGELVS